MADKMFCPKCGKAEQLPDSYCRGCGIFLPDLANAKKPTPPEEHVLANTVLSSMTIVASFTLAILLWTVLAFKPETHPLIYVTAGLLFAMGIWHIQTLWRTIQLRRHLKRSKRPEPDAEEKPQEADELNAANFDGYVPASVTDRTTTKLRDRR